MHRKLIFWPILTRAFKSRSCQSVSQSHALPWNLPNVLCWDNLRVTLTSHISLKSFLSILSNSQVDRVTTVLSLGESLRTDSPKVAPTPRVHSVTDACNTEKSQHQVNPQWTQQTSHQNSYGSGSQSQAYQRADAGSLTVWLRNI